MTAAPSAQNAILSSQDERYPAEDARVSAQIGGKRIFEQHKKKLLTREHERDFRRMEEV